MAKMIVAAAAALLLGLVIGGMGPRRELTKVRAELAEARAAAKRGGGTASLPLALGVGSLVAAQERARERAETARRPPKFVTPPPDRKADAPDAGSGRRGRFGFGDEASFQAAKTAADLRASQFRAAFVEQARLPSEKLAAFDTLVTEMNGQLGKVADELAQTLSSRGSRLTPRDMADIGARVLDVYRSSDDKFKGLLDDQGRAALADTQFDLLTQIDLAAFRRLAETVDNVGVSSPGGRP